jgi:integrase
VRQILKKRSSQAGITGIIWEPVTPHGTRAGLLTTAYKHGVPNEEIVGQTRHRSLTTMRGYVRRAKLDTKSPVCKVGL